MPYLSNCLYRVAQIREVERIAIEDLKITGLELMHRAGQTAFTELQRRWPEQRQLTVFCGAGNNGGDGYVLAELALSAGYSVCVYSVTAAEALKGDARSAWLAFVQAGGKAQPFSAATPLPQEGLIVDALLGTGLNRPVGDEFAAAIELINAAGLPVLAVDIPSGLYADSGKAGGYAVKADVTVTFISLKCGLFSGEAADYCGGIVLSGLDLPTSVFADMTPTARLLKKSLLPKRPRSAHKGRFGHVLLLGGNYGYSGAIRLAAEAALRSGAGLVSIATRSGHSELLNFGRPELMCHAVENIDQLTVLLNKATVVVIGPGMGQDVWAQTMLATVLTSRKLCVMDADALNLLAKQPLYRDNWVLTPHPGEAARLLACTTAEIAADRFTAVAALQKAYGGVSVLKGAGSLIADGHNIQVNTTGNPGMAGGGMGDVLSGMIGALLAQGLNLAEAAAMGVYVHGAAADRVAEQHGETGMLASDLFAEIRYCLNER